MEIMLLDIARLLLAIGVASIVGIERELSGKQVGMRTLSMVCGGSALVVIIAGTHFPDSVDRMFAGVVTGIGFLGAGSIIAHGRSIMGITTAATIWGMAIVGLSIGIGEYLLAMVFSLVIYLLLIKRKADDPVEAKVKKRKA